MWTLSVLKRSSHFPVMKATPVGYSICNPIIIIGYCPQISRDIDSTNVLMCLYVMPCRFVYRCQISVDFAVSIFRYSKTNVNIVN